VDCDGDFDGISGKDRRREKLAEQIDAGLALEMRSRSTPAIVWRHVVWQQLGLAAM
jgi:hypothetical protein